MNVDILEFKFKKMIDVQEDNLIAEIIYETDKLSSERDKNIKILESENCIIVKWKVNNTINNTAGIKRIQIIIKSKDKNYCYLSKIFEITVLESLDIDKEIAKTSITCLESKIEKLLNSSNSSIKWEEEQW